MFEYKTGRDVPRLDPPRPEPDLALGIAKDPNTGDFLFVDNALESVVHFGSQLGNHVSLRPFGNKRGRRHARPGERHLLDRGTRSSNGVYQLDASGSLVSSFGIPQTGAAEGIAFDAVTSHLLVLDRDQRRVFEYTAAGGFVKSTLLGFSSGPTGIVVVGSVWIVSDGASQTISQVDPTTGIQTSSFSTGAFSLNPQDVGIAANGTNLVLVDPSTGSVSRGHDPWRARAVVLDARTMDRSLRPGSCSTGRTTGDRQ